ncbi:MAG: MBL fold metallo-hydrolase [Lachnospiraceae bacterium]|nr:MBL fold metallo-hydrolase [Lachnospiraceae bacterium]
MVNVFWLGQMGLLVKSEKVTLCIDYYAREDAKRQTPAPIPMDELKDVDVFLGTHDHIDHIDHVAWKVWAKINPHAKFIFPRAHLQKVLEDGVLPENAIGLNDGENVEISGVRVNAVAASHEFLDRAPDTGLYPYLQYIVEIEGKRLHHAGDTVRYEGMLPKIKAFGKLDLQILPINGRDAVRYRDNCIGNMTFQEAADFAGEVEPAIIIPGHYDMFAHNSANPKNFADYIDAKYPGRMVCRIPDVMEKITL